LWRVQTGADGGSGGFVHGGYGPLSWNQL
jgi:hypothetical protein